MSTDFSPNSVWHTEAELNAASYMTDEHGVHVPYADLMKKAVQHLTTLRIENEQLKRDKEALRTLLGRISHEIHKTQF
jgi:hypothetical protein